MASLTYAVSIAAVALISVGVILFSLSSEPTVYSNFNHIPSNIAAWAVSSETCSKFETIFKFNVQSLNEVVRTAVNEGVSLKDIGTGIIVDSNNYLRASNDAARILKDTCNYQNLDNIAKLDPTVYKALEIYNLKPEDVPEFDAVTAAVLASAVGSMILAYRFYGNRLQGLSCK